MASAVGAAREPSVELSSRGVPNRSRSMEPMEMLSLSSLSLSVTVTGSAE
jgi:hypothetical protein